MLESEKRQKENDLAEAAMTLRSLGAPDSVRCARLALVKLAALGNQVNSVRLKFTGLSGEPTVGRAFRAGHVAEPTASRGHRTVRCAPDSVWCANCHDAAMVICAKLGRRSAPDMLQ